MKHFTKILLLCLFAITGTITLNSQSLYGLTSAGGANRDLGNLTEFVPNTAPTFSTTANTLIVCQNSTWLFLSLKNAYPI